jgi:hypothetical protein
MCHHVHVTLTAEERKEARKLTGLMIPVYASIVLAVIAVVAVSAEAGKANSSPRAQHRSRRVSARLWLQPN